MTPVHFTQNVRICSNTNMQNGPSSSFGIATKGWTVRESNPGGARFSARPDRPWGPPSFLYSGYRIFPRGKVRPRRAAEHSPPSSARSWKSRAILLPTVWATTGPPSRGTLYFYKHTKFNSYNPSNTTESPCCFAVADFFNSTKS